MQSMPLGVLSYESEYGPLRGIAIRKLLLRLHDLSAKLYNVCMAMEQAEEV